MTTDEILDVLIRDVTAVGSRPKSEVRRRIQEYADRACAENHQMDVDGKFKISVPDALHLAAQAANQEQAEILHWGEPILCSVCQKPIEGAVASCLCEPSHGQYHPACESRVHGKEKPWWEKEAHTFGRSVEFEVGEMLKEHTKRIVAELETMRRESSWSVTGIDEWNVVLDETIKRISEI